MLPVGQGDDPSMEMRATGSDEQLRVMLGKAAEASRAVRMGGTVLMRQRKAAVR